MKKFEIIKKSYMWLAIGAIIIIWSRLVFFMNIRFSTEFTGWLNIRVTSQVTKELDSALEAYLQTENYTVDVGSQQQPGYSDITISTQTQDDTSMTKLTDLIKNFLVENKYIPNETSIVQLSVTGPSVGKYMQNAAVKAVIVGLGLMVIYMLFAFAAIRKRVSPSILAAVTIVTMLFDISVPAGAYGLLMMINQTVQLDTVFIIAILTTMWYSINDTIVIFDRIRENMDKYKEEQDVVVGKVFEDSLRQTMRRSIGTSLSTLLVIVAMYIFGTGVIKQFSFTMGIGILAGSYSSIFLAAPLAYVLLGRFKKEQNKL